MLGDLRLHEGVERVPVHADPRLVGPNLPIYGRFRVELAALADELLLVVADLALLYLAAERAASLEIGEGEAVGLAAAEVLLELLDLLLLVDLGLPLLELVPLLSYLELVVVGDEVAHLLVDEQLDLLGAHPPGHHDDQRDVAELHLVGDLVVEPVQQPQVVLLAVEVGAGGERSDVGLFRVDHGGHRLEAVLAVLDLDHPTVRVGLHLDLADFAEVPQPAQLDASPLVLALAVDPHLLLAADSLRRLFALEVEHHAYLQVLELRHWLIAVVVGDEAVQPEAELIGEDEVVLPQQQVLKPSLLLGVQVILDDVVAVDLSEQVMRVLELCCFLEGLPVLLLRGCCCT